MSRRLEWLVEEEEAAEPLSCERPRGGLVDGRYELVERLGAGAMGVVYRADDVWLGRRVAIKVLAPGRAEPMHVELLRQEARALAKLRHDNVVQVYALGPHAGSFYIAMEYVAGPDLESLLVERAASGKRFDIGRALEIIAAVGHGLSAVHERGLTHRDVKPSNVLVETGTGRPVLVDFGLVAASRERAYAGGTPAYVSPEQAMNDHDLVGPRSDLYSLACMGYELLTGRLPFDDEDPKAIVLAHLRREAPRISTTRSSLAPFDDVFRRALAKTPEGRQPSCAAFVRELESAARRLGKRSLTPLTLAPPPDVTGARPLRVVVLENDEALRRQIVRVVDRTLRMTGETVEIEHVVSAAELGSACRRESPELVVIDEDTKEGTSGALVRALGDAVRALRSEPEVVLLRRDFDPPPSSPNGSLVRAVELPKPINAQVLASVPSRMAARIASRRSGAL